MRLSAPQILKSSFKNRRNPSAIHLKGAVAGVEYSASLRSRANSSQLAFASESLLENGDRVFSRDPSGARIERVRNEGDGREPRAISVETEGHRSLWDTHWAHSRFPGHALTPTGVMAIRCKQFHLPDL